jgi:hypothetical protein
MAQTPQSSDNDELRPGDDIDEVLGRANPNPNRIGCPPRETLVALARREQPIGDPAYEHLVKCSPCYREFRALQEAGAAAATTTASGVARRRWMLVAAAAAVIAGLAGAWWVSDDRTASPAPQVASAGRSPVRAKLDLRKFVAVRSEQAGPEAPPVWLPASVVDVTLLLPVGSEPGPYDVQLLDSNLRSQSQATGDGRIENFVTTIRVRMDLQNIASGHYQLAVRRQGDSWRMFPARID